MLTSRSALAMLGALATPAGVPPLLQALGFGGAARLDAATARALGIEAFRSGGVIVRRAGALRAMALVAHAHGVREVVEACVPRLIARAPEHRWVVVVVASNGGEAALTAVLDDGVRPRRATLLVDPRHPRESDAETLCALVAAAAGDDPLVHVRWHEILGRDALSARFYRALERHVVALGEGATGSAPSETRHALALTTASRLLFLCFLEGRGWLDGNANFLARHCDAAAGGGLQRLVLEPLFFGTLNTPWSRRASRARAFGRVPFLNGGLFTRSAAERRYRHLRFRDEDLAALFDEVLTRYRFTAFEDRGDASQAAIDPEMLGRAFESLMASRDRRETGAFYTPQSLVERTSEAALSEYLTAHAVPDETRALLLRGSTITAEGPRVLQLLQGARVIDPACGSGAFLVHMLERITRACLAAGDPLSRAACKRRVLTRSIFGVDLNPMAVWLCELRLWLSSLVEQEVEDPLELPPLPNLDRNVRVGDALDGGAWQAACGSTLQRDRERYVRATGKRKVLLARALDRAERRAAIEVIDARLASITEERWSLMTISRGRDLFGGRRGSTAEERLRRVELRDAARRLRGQRLALQSGGALPFRFASHFPDVMRAGGFDIAIGNPPWVRLHRIPPERREQFRTTYRVFRQAAWEGFAQRGAAFGAQVDLAALFAEQSMGLLRPDGVLAMLLPMKLWRSVAGGGVRRLLHGTNTIRVVEDWSDAPAAFDAAAYPSLVVARQRAPQTNDDVQLTIHRQRMAVSWTGPARELSFDGIDGAPWVTLPPDALRVFRRLAERGHPMAQRQVPQLGVKCGLNDAFLVSAPRGEGPEVIVSTVRGNVRLEASMLRPVLRGEQVRPWRMASGEECIVWTHGADGRPLRALPDHARRWLARWRGELASRSDARGNAAWWSLFRIDGAINERPRVVWADMSRGPRALILPSRSPVVPLNTCYVLPCRDDSDAAAIATLLNSPLVAAWLGAIAEPARGGYRRYLAWTVAALPLPRDWERARHVLAPLGTRARGGDVPTDTELLAAACEAYRMSVRSVEPLVEWAWR